MTNHTEPDDDGNTGVQELENQLRVIQAAGVTDPYAFSSRTLIQATFPHSARAGKEKVLRNGNVTVTMYSRKGLPYGHYPRLIMCWLTREALRRNSHLPVGEARRIPLGDSLNGFLRDVGIIRGVYNGELDENGEPTARRPKKRASGNSYNALRTQLDRLFSTTVSIDYEQTINGRQGTGWDNVQLSDEGFLWWDDQDVRGSEAYVLLTEKFFRDLVDGAVPLDPVHLAGISRHPLALDLYCWATYRIATHKGFTRVTWEQLKGQIGTSYPDTKQGIRDFRRNVRLALKEVSRVWPAGKISDWDGGLELRGHDPAVPKKAKDDFLKPDDYGPRF